MRRKIIVFTLMAAFCVNFAACENKIENETHSVPNATVETYIGNGSYLTFADLPCDPNNSKLLKDYIDCGFNVFAIHQDHVGVITDGTSNNGGLTDKYKAALQTLTGKDVDIWIRNHNNDPDYYLNSDPDKERFVFGYDYKLPVRDLGTDDFDPYNVTGFFVGDEPAMYAKQAGKSYWHGIAEYEKIVDWYNDRYADSGKFFHMNLFPRYANQSFFDHPTDITKSVTYEQYVDYYVENFAKIIKGPKSICVDNYPFRDEGKIRDNFYENLLLFANKTRDCNKTIVNEAYKAKFGMCVQSFKNEGLQDITCAEDISYQMCVAVAMGAEMLQYYLYASISDSQQGIMTKTWGKRIYDYVKEANDGYLPFGTITTNFLWQGLTQIPASKVENQENKDAFDSLAGALTMSEMSDLKGVTATRDAVIGYFTHKGSNQPGYMIANCSLPSAGASNTVVLDFKKHERVIVYSKSADGKTVVGEEMKTIGGKLRLSLAAGDGKFVVPV